MSQANDLTERTFRCNPAYRCEQIDRSSDPGHTRLLEQISNPQITAVFRPAPGDLGTQVAGSEVALLFQSLATPSKLPRHWMAELSGDNIRRILSVLILDQIIEVETDQGFLSGIEAHHILFKKRSSSRPDDAIGRLSVAALKYGQALMMQDYLELSARLYCFNRTPASAYWRSQLSSRSKVAEFLGIGSGGCNHEILERYWIRVSGQVERPEWLSWQRNNLHGHSQAGRRYKLYISPEPKCLRDALQVTLPIISGLGAHTFKVGSDMYGVLRPDKLVAYFSNRARMLEAAKQIRSKLSGVPAQGVPFSGSLDANGAVSWGVDPPKHVLHFPWNGRSWRYWVTDRLATALITGGRRVVPFVSAWEFALDRVRLDGVDTELWEPDPNLWGEEDESA